jgi:uncharacterized protein YecT (DUF1311 family)
MVKNLDRIFYITMFLVISQNVNADNLPDCSNPAGGYATGYCSEQQLKLADKQLNSTYQQLMNKLSKDQKGILVTAQRSWMKLRDNDCELEQYYNRGTTGWARNFVLCKTKKTKNRIQQLESFAKDIAFEGKFDR